MERKQRLNKSFEFTPHNISKLTDLNEQLKACEQELLQQSIRLEKSLLADPELQAFLSDYEITCRIELYLPDSCSADEPASDHLFIDSNSEVVSEYCFGGKLLEEDELAFYKTNWNEHFDRVEFRDVRFCYTFHHFVDHTPMSLQDLIHIEKVWGEVEVKYQKCINIS